MALGPRLELRQSQQLVMTPQLQLAIKLLTLTNVELETYIGEELEKNPLLMAGEPAESAPEATGIDGFGEAQGAEAAPADPLTDGLDRLLGGGAGSDAPLDADYTGEKFHHDCAADQPDADWSERAAVAGDEEGFDFGQLAAPAESLADVLEAQADAAFDGAELILARHIIDAIDVTGYLAEDLGLIAERLGVEPAVAEAVLARI